MWSIGEGNGKPLQYSCLENPMNNMKRQKDRILIDEPLTSVGALYVTGDQWRNNSRRERSRAPGEASATVSTGAQPAPGPAEGQALHPDPPPGPN